MSLLTNLNLIFERLILREIDLVSRKINRMGSYRPRPTEVKQCQHCTNSFESRHKRTIYCSESCRQLAYQARHSLSEKKSEPSNDLTFSATNIGVTAAGATVTAFGNYLLNDLPAQQAILTKLDSIEKGTEQGLNQLLGATQTIIDFMNIQLRADPNLRLQMQNAQAKRLADQQHREEAKQVTVARVLAKRRGHRH